MLWRRLFALAFALFLVVAPVAGAANAGSMVRLGSGCDEHYIVNVPGDSDGAIVKTDDGHIYEVDDMDRVDSELWLTTDDVLVCWDRMRYKGRIYTFYTLRDGEDKADASRLR